MSSDPADSRDERIGRVLNEYLDRKLRGEPVCEAELCEAHPDLADELRAHFGMVRQVSSVASGEAQDEGPFIAPPHDALPGYEILGELHRGGQGVVYEAMQKATRRKVAIKVMREGPFAGWRDRARFEREVQVLAALKHPGIVTIHDSGTAAGCHFFVMDYIVGAPLDVWAGSAPRSIEEILKLFVEVCRAVNAAHIKGVIHRDLKPGNIRIDTEGSPHVLDFGLAKLSTPDEAADEPADMTMLGQFVGSLPWTSPEQAQGRLDHVDTRTDVYALGVILYHMLTGAFPYEVTGPMRDVLNRIVASEPVRPCAIRKELDRDVEAIVLTCLQKESHRRYQTAGELGRDIQRYLDGQAVAARADSGLYVLGKMLRRHRVPVMVAVAFAVLIGVSLVTSLSFWRKAVLDRARADAQAADARQARHIAEREQARAEAQAEQLRRVAYLNQMALARNAYEQGYLTRARQLLEDCPAGPRGWEWHYLSRLATSPVLLDVVADSESVAALAISPDGRHIASGGGDGVIRLWDAATGDPVADLAGHSGQVNTLAFSPDGRWIASGGRDRTLRLWDTTDGTQRVLERGEQYINGVAFSPDGTRLVAGGQARVLAFWDVQTAKVVYTTPAHEKEISCVACSPDGSQVVSGELLNPLVGRAKIRIWDAATGRSIRELEGHPGAVLSVAFSADGTRIASGGGVSPSGTGAQGTLKVFDAATGEVLVSLDGHEGFVDAVAFSPDGGLLASAGTPRTPAFGLESDHTLKIWDVGNGTELCTYSAHRLGGRAVVWSRDGSRVFSGGMDGRLKAWPSTPTPRARVLRGHGGPVLRIAFSPDGRRLASCGGQGTGQVADGRPDNAIRVWDLETGETSLILEGHRDAVGGLAWSPDGRHIASGGADRSVRLWDSSDGRSERLLAAPGDGVRDVAFSPDGELLGCVAGRMAVIWTTADGNQRAPVWHSEPPVTIAFSPDGQRIITASPGGEVRMWDSASGSARGSISASPGLNGAWFSPDSGLIATAHAGGTILLWNPVSGRQAAEMSGPQRAVQWIDFSPDGQRIASCAADMMLKVWDVPSATEVFSLRAHEAPVTCVRFSPEGRSIATCGQDGLIKLWQGGSADAAMTTTSAAGRQER